MSGKKAFDLPGHEVRKVLRDVPNQGRTVLLTHFAGVDCVTRIWHSRLRVDHHEVLHQLAAGQSVPTSPLPADLASDFEGYRVRARLAEFPWLPDVVNVGMLRNGLEPEGRPYISTRWIEGRPLHLCWPGFGHERRERVLREVLFILNEMHCQGVLHGDLKAENVIVGDLGTRLIDLDTLREVPDAFTPVEVSQITALYSSPEQSHERQAYLSSDLYAYGMLVAQLLGECQPLQPGFPPRLEPPWDTVMAACLREKPLERPRTEELLRAVNGEPTNLESWTGAPADEATVRVPDPPRAEVHRLSAAAAGPRHGSASSGREAGRTERVADPPAALARAARAFVRPAASRGGLRRLLSRANWSVVLRMRGEHWRRNASLAMVALMLLTAVGLGRTGWLPHDEPSRDPEVARIIERLHGHKTDLAKNNPAYLAGVVEDAGLLVEDEASAERWGAFALARVWQQGWQFSGATWDLGKFSEAEKLTQRAFQAGPSAEAILARAILTGAACRLLPVSYAGRTRYCRESVERSDEAFRRIDSGWLMVEARWNAVLVEGLDPDDAARAHGLAVGNCEAARDLLGQAPINGVEMAEDCALVASRAGDTTAWLWWARWILEHGADAGKDIEAMKRHVFRSAHPACSARAARRLDAPFTGKGADALAYCAYMTEMALGCPERASRHVCSADEGSRCPLPPPTDSIPWDVAGVLRDQATDVACERLQ
jgi:hypothetical protein